MIFGNSKYESSGTQINDSIRKCISFISENDLKNWDLGSHEIEGRDFFVNILSYKTKKVDDCIWEAHKQYLDVHYILEGTEKIDLNFIDNLEIKEYQAEKDYLPLEGKKASSVTMVTGDFLVCYPEDAHMTAIQVEDSVLVKKAIFKIKIV